jgi:hypothetical protein
MKVNEPSEPWPCDWDGHELAQLRRDASRTFRQKLIWLEETTEFVKKLQAAKRHDGPITPLPTNE